ncbi:hypothetical protein GIB67_037720 [Kingdonia uniflora]|uniref:SWIM-type domain-containing protein n=1 Tax=Kingdonia uniflora TaxID=39325 RepID=A0A7J7LN25_9MAGN|nr:hypothetical protein GIB67_037720 [Kingdonia uniflora]
MVLYHRNCLFISFVSGMNGVQLYTIAHFGGDIVRPRIRSIVTNVGGSTKLISLRAHSSYEDFVTLLEETNEIRREDCKLYNFVHSCACAISSVQDFTLMINMYKTNPGTPFHIWIVNDLRVHSQNFQNFIFDFCSSSKGLSTTKDTGLGRGLSTAKAGGPLRHNSFSDLEPEYRGYPETNGKGLDLRRFGPFVDDENDSFETIRTDVPPSNEHSIPQSNIHLSNEPVIHLSNEPVLTNVPPSNEPMLTNVPLSIEPEPIIGQTETSAEFRFEPQLEQVKNLLDFRFKSAAYTEDPYDFSKEFNIGDLYRDRIELKNRIRDYAVVNKFNLEHVLSNEYKIVIRGSFEHAYQLLTSYFVYKVAYTSHDESWNNVILEVRDLSIHVFIEELCRISLEMSYTYREEAVKNQTRLTPWATDHCESRKFVADLLTCRVRTSRRHFQMTSYGRTDYANIEDGICYCRWWQTMGIPCKHGVHALGLANVDPTTRVFEYHTNNTYKSVYEPI